MRGHIKITSCLLALSMLTGCSKWKHEEPEITFDIQAINLEGAKAIAHLQNGDGTKASIDFDQKDALYLVYDNNEIRLPEIRFTVEVPDSYSEREKEEIEECVEVTLEKPKIKDVGKYIYVYSSLTYQLMIPGILSATPGLQFGPGGQFTVPHCNTLVRKSDGLCLTVDDNIGGLLYEDGSLIEEDSQGRCYLVSYSGYADRVQVGRLIDEEDGVQINMIDVVDKDHRASYLPCMLVSDDIAYFACNSLRNDVTNIHDINPSVALVAVSPDLTCQRTYFEGDGLVGLGKYGNDIYLFGLEEGLISGGTENVFKVYDVTSGCDLVASTTFAYEAHQSLGNLTGNRSRPFEVISEKNGVFTCYILGSILQFDAKNGESTVSALDEVVRGYISNSLVWLYPGGDLYLAHRHQEGNYVELLKIDVQTGTVEQLKKFDVPGGFDADLVLVDESEGRLRLTVDNTSADVVDPEIAAAYAKANAIEGIDFGSYKVVNVVPLDDNLEFSEN